MTEAVRLPLPAEILAPGEKLIVACWPHPLYTAARVVTACPGDRLSEIVQRCESELAAPGMYDRAQVKVDGIALPREWWPRIRVRPGAHVEVRAVPGDFIITPIVGAIVTNLGITSALGAGLIKLAVTAGIGLLAQLTQTVLFPPTSTKAETPKQVYSIGGSRNEIVKWDPIPVIWGKMRVAGIHLTAPFTQFEGDDQYVYMLICWGYGPLDISDIKIGETPIGEYDDVEIETFEGYLNPSDYSVVSLRGKPDHYNQKTVRNAVFQEDMSVELVEADGWTSRTTAEDCIRIQADFVLAEGLYEVKDDGYDEQFVKWEAEYRLDGSSGAWSSLEVIELRGDDPDPIRRTSDKKVPKGKYDVRARRVLTEQLAEDGA